MADVCIAIFVSRVNGQASVERVSGIYSDLSQKYHTEKADNPENSLTFN